TPNGQGRVQVPYPARSIVPDGERARSSRTTRRVSPMLSRSLVTLGAVLMTSTVLAQDISPVADFVTTDKANDLRGIAYGADGKIYVSGHRGDSAAENNPQTVVVVGRLNADGTPDTSFSDDGFAEVDLGPGVEQSLAVAPLANGDVVAAVN